MHSPTSHHRLIIIGSGPAGCTAALYAARASLSPVLITGTDQGGQLMKTSAVDNWPADVDGVIGPVLMERFIRHAERFEAQIVYDQVTNVDLSARPFELTTSNDSYTTDALIIATGASAKPLGLLSEERFAGRGVSGCATCDGYHFKGQRVAIVGGGNTAVEEAIMMSNIASHVTLIHRRNGLRAEPILVKHLEAKSNAGQVDIVWNHEVTEVIGDDKGVTGVALRDVETGYARALDVTGLFVAIGHLPNTALFEGKLETQNGYIVTGSGAGSTSTNIPGVFAAGDVQDRIYRQAVTSAASGCMAALDASRFLESNRAYLPQ